MRARVSLDPQAATPVTWTKLRRLVMHSTERSSLVHVYVSKLVVASKSQVKCLLHAMHPGVYSSAATLHVAHHHVGGGGGRGHGSSRHYDHVTEPLRVVPWGVLLQDVPRAAGLIAVLTNNAS